MSLGVLYRLYERNLVNGLDRDRLPRHIGIVLDGHRRHAREGRLPTYTDSYRVGMRRVEECLGWADELEIPAVTAWVLSRENLSRPGDELYPYFEVLVELFDRLPALCAHHHLGVRLLGSLDPLRHPLVSG